MVCRHLTKSDFRQNAIELERNHNEDIGANCLADAIQRCPLFFILLLIILILKLALLWGCTMAGSSGVLATTIMAILERNKWEGMAEAHIDSSVQTMQKLCSCSSAEAILANGPSV